MDWKMTVVFLIIGLLVGFGIGCVYVGQMQPSEDNEDTELTGDIVVKGSDTLLVVAQGWAENFTARYPGVSISVAGGGSGTGFAALKAKTTDIADASREIKETEIQDCKANGVNPVEWVVGLDGISIVVHPDNIVNELTLEQLEKIFNGTYTNWNQVGGNDGTIVAYGRQSTSGTFDFFREHVLHKKDFRDDKVRLAGNAEIVRAVEDDVNGIGYVGVAYTKGGVNVKIQNIKNSEISPVYEPTVANIKSGAYPIARKLYIYTDGNPESTLEIYVSFIMGPMGQQILEDVGYISYIKLEK